MIKINKDNIRNFYAFIIFFSGIFLWDIDLHNLNIKSIIYPTIIISFLLDIKKNSLRSLIICFLLTLLILIHYLLTTNHELISTKDILEIILIFFLFFFCKNNLDYFLKNIDKFVYSFMILFFFSIFLNIQENTFTLDYKDKFNLNLICSYHFGFLSENYIFKEKSHLGMVTVGVFLLFLDRILNNKINILTIIIGLFLFLLFINASTTFFVGYLLSLLIIFIFNPKFIKRFVPYFFITILILVILTYSSSCKKRFSQIPNILKTYEVQDKLIKELSSENELIVTNENKINLSKDEQVRFEFNEIYQKRTELIGLLHSKKVNLDRDRLIIQLTELENRLIKLDKKLYKQLTENFNNNLTSQVQIRALYVAKNSLLDKPFGYGYDNYYLANNYYKHFIISSNPYADVLNSRDGTNLTVKLLVEFGLISLIFFVICFYFLLSNKIEFELKLFLLPFLITQGIRGAGYWNGGFLIIFMIILLIILKGYKIKN